MEQRKIIITMQPVLRQSTTLSYNSYCFKRQDVTGVNHDSINAFAQSLPSMPWGTTVLILSHHFTSCLFSRAGPEYSIIRIFVRWVGIRFSILRFEYHFFFFLNTWHPPQNVSQLVRLAEHLQQTIRQWKMFVLTYSMHIFHEKSSIMSTLAAHLHLK